MTQSKMFLVTIKQESEQHYLCILLLFIYRSVFTKKTISFQIILFILFQTFRTKRNNRNTTKSLRHV